jgi:hypothetical protein
MRILRFHRPLWLLLVTSCHGGAPPAVSSRLAPQTFALEVAAVDTTFVTRDQFMAALEMQLSGEPFAEAMGRDLRGYSRDYICQSGSCSPDTYFDPALNDGVAGGPNGRIDLAGFSSAVESQEYSKQPTNNIAFESGAGTSLVFGPVLNPSGASGSDAQVLLRAWVQRLAVEANTVNRFVTAVVTPNNPVGWPGLWPTLQPYAVWDPTIAASDATTGCSISSDDDPGGSGSLTCDDYECDYTTLHLPSRAAQIEAMTIDPGSSGWAGWNEALWTLDYLRVMHDSHEDPVETVPGDELTQVGAAGNTILGAGGPGAPALPGTFLGASDIEGFQAGNFIQLLDNQAEQWLTQLTTTDGATLSGFASLSAALAYGSGDPLRWFPGSIAVTETADASGFPEPASYAIASPDSHLLDLAGLLGSFSSLYALTDQANAQVGGSLPALAYFDGDPFPVQNQTPTGAPTLHDRALAMIRVLIVNIARLHVDPASGLFVDDVALAGGSVSRGTTLSADVAAYALLALRTARRGVDSLLTLDSNAGPDAEGIASSLDALSPVDGLPYSARLDQLVGQLTAIFLNQLTTDEGVAFGGWSLARSAPTDAGTSLDAHTAAIRGLLTAYLATGDTRYRDRAQSVFNRLDSQFYDPRARVYRAAVGDGGSQVTFTPRRFGLLQGALRDSYQNIALLPGNEAMRTLIEDRVARLNKLVLNGWDDRDEDEIIEWPSECAHLGTGPDGQPLGLGGLQMAERVLSGDSGSLADTLQGSGRDPDRGRSLASGIPASVRRAPIRVITTDREHDCVPEVSAAGLPSALASSITFTLTPWSPDSDEGKILP